VREGAALVADLFLRADVLCPGLPIWFRLGVANYVTECEFTDGKPKIGTYRRVNQGSPIVTRFERLKESLRSDACLPLNSLLTLEDKEFMDPTNNREQVNTAHSWSFVHFLLHDKEFPDGKKLFTQLFTDVRAGLTKEEAFARGLGRLDLRKVEATWRAFAEKM
ncbi:MAG: DUF1570 domain-containing protein, partial [Planctomycetes bacterium]|nr:DUF1570 domain-containing protein [Planctomycetota bacterium]